MSIVSVAKEALSDATVGGVIRERLSLALDEAATLERKVEELQMKVGELRGELRLAQTHELSAKQELERLKKEHEEDIVIMRTVEFRRGKRTGGNWQLFCPKCHLPLISPINTVYRVHCSDSAGCKWLSALPVNEIDATIKLLPN